jgi:hypothetical protein
MKVERRRKRKEERERGRKGEIKNCQIIVFC